MTLTPEQKKERKALANKKYYEEHKLRLCLEQQALYHNKTVEEKTARKQQMLQAYYKRKEANNVNINDILSNVGMSNSNPYQ